MTDETQRAEAETPKTEQRRGWRRAAGLFLLAIVTSVAPPAVLVAVPLLVLIGLGGIRSFASFTVTVLAMMVTVVGPRDGLWFVERGWALIVGGAFAALTLSLPRWRLTSRSIAAVLGAAGVTAGLVALRAGAWTSIDWGMGDRLRLGFAAWVDAMQLLRGGDPVPAATVTAAYQTADALVEVFPAVLALESLAALAVSWWIYVRLVHRRDDGIGTLGSFRFNDHLVWLMIAGLVLVGMSAGGALARLGANLAVFMGALYALRGMGVVAALSGGLSFFGASVLAVGLLLAAPVVLGLSVVLGIADTWLDVRERVGSLPA